MRGALLFALVSVMRSQAPRFNRTDEAAFDTAFQSAITELMYSFDNNTGVFGMPPQCGGSPPGFWNTANALTAMALKDERRGDGRNTQWIKYVLARHLGPSKDLRPSRNIYNDDHLWWLFVACQMAQLDDGDERWLKAARRGWDEVVKCVTDECGGSALRSLSWTHAQGPAGGCVPPAENSGYKASIANSLLMLVSAALYDITGEAKYRDTAEAQWAWLSASVLDNVTGLMHDGLSPTGGSRRSSSNSSREECVLHPTFWSYNQGVPIAALVTLHRAIGRRTGPNLTMNAWHSMSPYLAAAQQLATSSITHFSDANNVAYETACESDASCGCDGVEFRGPFVRGLGILYEVQPDPVIGTFLNDTLTSALLRCSNGQWQFALHWDGPYDVRNATAATQMPILDLFAAVYTVCFSSSNRR